MNYIQALKIMIKSVQFASNRNSTIKNNIVIAPPARDRGSITIICGKNHSGKTYITKRIHRSITQRNEDLANNKEESIIHTVDNINVEYSPNIREINAILISRVDKITDSLRSVSAILESSHNNSKYLQQSDYIYRIQIKQALAFFCFDSIDDFNTKKNNQIDKTKWFDPDNLKYRSESLSSADIEKLYLCKRSHVVVKIFEDLTQGKLYFGINHRKTPKYGIIPEFELRLVFNGEIIIPIGGWSEGQKVLFALLLFIYYVKPDILIIDEIENHLHPEYVSTLLDYIKQNIKQTIITTHHPHIIFSKHVDIVNYLEFNKESDDLPEIIDTKSSDRLRTMKLNNVLLEKNYSKLLSTYKLFDAYDNQLLRLSTTSISDLNDLLIEIFTSLFNYDIVSPQLEKKPDLQSQKLYEIFQKKLHEQKLEILEFGAGEGRLLIDIDKVLKTPEKDKIAWSLYEPYDSPRKKLISNLRKHPYKDLINIYSEKPTTCFDFIIIPNVLHELTPCIIAEILTYCSKSLKEKGSIIIVELYPLLKPEKYAVPLNRNEWDRLARKIGFKASSNGIIFKNAIHDAYFTQLFISNTNNEFNQEKIEELITKFWITEVLPERINNYDGHIRFGDIDEIPTSIGNLCTIASINAYQNKIWK